MTWTEPTRCAICGWTDKRDLRFALVHWLEAEPGMAYQHVEACRDRDACRARVADQGETWPLVESKRKEGAA
jgi:hypothetical protein